MSTKSDSLENSLLKLLFNAVAIANVADNAASSPLTTLKVSLHTAEPGDAGDQTTSEATYGGYARVSVNRTTGGWVVTANSVSPAATISFPECTAGSNTITHFGIGTATSGAGILHYYGTVSPNISVSTGVTPRLTTSTAIVET